VPGVSERGGGPQSIGVVARARARAKELLQTHEVPPLPEDTIRHLDEIMARAHRELVKE
jgi:trimethylamine:corrinoid methyltransferase-like protein